MRPATRVVLAAMALVAAAPLSFGSAGAGVVDPLAVDLFPSGEARRPVFGFSVPGNECVQDPVVTVAGVPGATVELDDQNNGTITLPVGTAGGTYIVTLECSDGKSPVRGDAEFRFAAVTVTKVVVGPAPADATFAVRVDCTERSGLTDPASAGAFGGHGEGGSIALAADLSFGTGGGTEYLVAYTPQDCAIDESDDGGATATDLLLEDCRDPLPPVDAEVEAAEFGDRFSVIDPVNCTQTFTNVFATVPPPPAPPPPPTPPPPPAPAADVLVRQPAFTG